MKSRIFTLLIAWSIAVFIYRFVVIYYNNEIDATSAQISKIKREINDLSVKNSILEEHIYHFEALTMIASEASQMGFIKAQDYIILK